MTIAFLIESSFSDIEAYRTAKLFRHFARATKFYFFNIMKGMFCYLLNLMDIFKLVCIFVCHYLKLDKFLQNIESQFKKNYVIIKK